MTARAGVVWEIARIAAKLLNFRDFPAMHGYTPIAPIASAVFPRRAAQEADSLAERILWRHIGFGSTTLRLGLGWGPGRCY